MLPRVLRAFRVSTLFPIRAVTFVLIIGLFPYSRIPPLLLWLPKSDREGGFGFAVIASDTVTLSRSFRLSYDAHHVLPRR